MEKNDDCVILAAGDYPTHPMARSILENATHVICCDSAAKAYIDRGHTPYAIVGDGDSLPTEYRTRYAHLLHTIAEQEYNDLTKATQFAIAQGFRKFSYLGCTGLREDHTLNNIALLAFYQRTFHIQPVMYTDQGTFTPAIGTHTFPSFPHQQVSLFRFPYQRGEEEKGQFSSEGLRWNAYPYAELWQGTLNEAVGDTFTIHSDGQYIIFQTYMPK